MEKYVGQSANGGIAIGSITIYHTKEPHEDKAKFKGEKIEIQRYKTAKPKG